MGADIWAVRYAARHRSLSRRDILLCEPNITEFTEKDLQIQYRLNGFQNSNYLLIYSTINDLKQQTIWNKGTAISDAIPSIYNIAIIFKISEYLWLE